MLLCCCCAPVVACNDGVAIFAAFVDAVVPAVAAVAFVAVFDGARWHCGS